MVTHKRAPNPLWGIDVPESLILHFHTLWNGRIFLVNALRKTRLCGKADRCALIEVTGMKVLHG